MLEHLLCEERLKRLGFPRLKRRRLRGAVVTVYKVITTLTKLKCGPEQFVYYKRLGEHNVTRRRWFKAIFSKKIETCCPQSLWRTDTVSVFRKEVDEFMDKKPRNGYWNDHTNMNPWHPACNSCGCLGRRRGTDCRKWTEFMVSLNRVSSWFYQDQCTGLDGSWIQPGWAFLMLAPVQRGAETLLQQHRWKC